MNLQEFIDMTTGEGEGQVMDYKSFIKNFASNDWLYLVLFEIYRPSQYT